MDMEFLDIQFERGKCIIVPATLYASVRAVKSGFEKLGAILDTGATSTHISKSLLLDMGYYESDFTTDTKTSLSITGSYNATICIVQRFVFCGLAINDLPIKVWEPPVGHHVRGVIGMDLLRHYNIHINTDTARTTINHSNATTQALQKTQNP